MNSAAEIIDNLRAELAQAEAVASKAIAHLGTREREHDAEMRVRLDEATAQAREFERAMWWLLAQVSKDPRPLRHDDDCWLRHLYCFAERLRHSGDLPSLARDLSAARARGDVA